MKDNPELKGAGPDSVSLRSADIELLRAVQLGETEAVGRAISDGADVNCIDPEDSVATPIVHAAWKGYSDIVRLLLDKGADPNARNIGTNSALMLAARFGQTEVVKMLISKGADVSAKDRSGDTAVENASGHPEIQALLNEARNSQLLKQRDDFVTSLPKSVRVLSPLPVHQLDANWLVRFLSLSLKGMLGHKDLKESVDLLQGFLRTGLSFSINGNLPVNLLEDHIYFEWEIRRAFPQFRSGCRLRPYHMQDPFHSNSPTTVLWVFPLE